MEIYFLWWSCENYPPHPPHPPSALEAPPQPSAVSFADAISPWRPFPRSSRPPAVSTAPERLVETGPLGGSKSGAVITTLPLRRVWAGVRLPDHQVAGPRRRPQSTLRTPPPPRRAGPSQACCRHQGPPPAGCRCAPQGAAAEARGCPHGDGRRVVLPPPRPRTVASRGCSKCFVTGHGIGPSW
jgi:hypothetical protein